MIGIIYSPDDHIILNMIPDVQSVTETDIIGANASAKGIDLSLLSFCIVDSTDLTIGETLGTFTDVRHLIPKSPEQIQIQQLKEELAAQNASNLEFMEMILSTLGV